MQPRVENAISTDSRLQKFWNDLLTTFIPFLNLQTWKKFSIISSKHNLYPKGELAEN